MKSLQRFDYLYEAYICVGKKCKKLELGARYINQSPTFE